MEERIREEVHADNVVVSNDNDRNTEVSCGSGEDTVRSGSLIPVVVDVDLTTCEELVNVEDVEVL